MPADTDTPDIVEYEHVDLEQVAEKEQAASQAETDAKLAKRAAVSKFQQHIAEEALQHHTSDFSCLILLRQLNVCFWLSVCVKIRSVPLGSCHLPLTRHRHVSRQKDRPWCSRGAKRWNPLMLVRRYELRDEPDALSSTGHCCMGPAQG